MKGDRPLLIATLAADTPEEARSEIAALGTGTADVAEVRTDRWDIETPIVEGVELLLPSPVPLLVTYRSRAEGGGGEDDPPSRASILRGTARLEISFLDVEAHRDAQVAAEIRNAHPQVRLVLSTHLDHEPTHGEWSRLVEPPRPGYAFSKVVFPCGLLGLVREVLPWLPPPDFPYVVHTTDTSGPLLRAWGKRLGLAAVYAGPPSFRRRPAIEPSQLPVDRLRRFFDAAGHPPLFAVVGHPVAHSRSPELHNRWMAADRRDGLYIALDVPTERDLLELVPVLAAQGFQGLNVTHPLKEAAFEASTESSARAEACGCANVLSFVEGDVVSDNTDVVAMGRRLTELRTEGWEGDRLTVIGSGGTARSTLVAARDLGIECEIVARNANRAQKLSKDFGVRVNDVGDRRASLLINATPVGHPDAGALEAPIGDQLSRTTRVLDWVYGVSDSELARRARAAGARYEDGERLLLYQAEASYEIWWGNSPPNDESVPARGGA